MFALTYYGLKRLVRHRATVLALVALPVGIGLARLTLGKAMPLWIGPAVCAIATAAVFYIQHRDDAASGLLDALSIAPIRESAEVLSRAAAALLVVCLQIAVFWAIASATL